jgi:hypothetical protein
MARMDKESADARQKAAAKATSMIILDTMGFL